MSLRRRLALLSAAGGRASRCVLASALVYALVRDSLRGQIDDDAARGQARPGASQVSAGAPLGAGGRAAARPPPGRAARRRARRPPRRPAGRPPIGQVIIAERRGRARRRASDLEIPVATPGAQLAASGGRAALRGRRRRRTDPLRVLTSRSPEGGAVQVARSLEDTEDTLSDLLLILVPGRARGGIAARRRARAASSRGRRWLRPARSPTRPRRWRATQDLTAADRGRAATTSWGAWPPASTR